MHNFFRAIIFFLALVGGLTLIGQLFDLEYGSDDYWDHHGVLFLLAITLFPRLTLLFSSVSFGGLLWWLGFLFAPRLLVAILATLAYWEMNPVLVVFSWLVALSGESSEKLVVVEQLRMGSGGVGYGASGTIIDGEYRRVDD